MSDSPRFRKTALLGIGLMGGSLGLALRDRRLTAEIVGVARRRETRETALHLGIVDRATDSVAEAASGADLIVLGTPLLAYEGLLRDALPHLKPGCIVTDLGSAKAESVKICERSLSGSGAAFVGGHPMTGSEATGPEAARSDLYEGAIWCLAPTDSTDPAALEAIRLMAEAVGSRVVVLSPEEHDGAVAATSHLPHLAAVALVGALEDAALETPVAALLTAGGFRDATRIASGSPAMWRDICLANRDSIMRAIRIFRERLSALESAIAEGDGSTLEFRLESARSYREEIMKRIERKS